MAPPYGSSPRRGAYDAVVVGAGPNGLAAAITLARAGWSVLVVEARDSPGGGSRSAELTLPGHLHDVCASIFALGAVSPFFRSLPPDQVPLTLGFADVPCAHPLGDGAAVLYRSVEETADALGRDAAAYRQLMAPLVRCAEELFDQLLGPVRLPSRPAMLARFGWRAMRSAKKLAGRFTTAPARALIAGMAAHSGLPLDRPVTAAVAMMLLLAGHSGGWPVSMGGSRQIVRCLCDYLETLGGEIIVDSPVTSLRQLPPSRAVLLDVVPRTLLDIAGDSLGKGYRRRLKRFRHGLGVYKVDWALEGPIPWMDASCARAGTVHVGGTFEEIADAEQAPWRGRLSGRPFVLVTQPSVVDPSRAPRGRHTAWGYCRVPPTETASATDRIESQIERYAPGFRARILARHVTTPADLENYNANYVGGDISAGVMDWRQLMSRPVLSWSPYATPNPRVFLCSASTPPGPGVHGMCGFHAAQAVLRQRSI